MPQSVTDNVLRRAKTDSHLAATTVRAFDSVFRHCFSLSCLSSLNTFKIRLFHDSVGNAIFLSSFLMRGAVFERGREIERPTAMPLHAV